MLSRKTWTRLFALVTILAVFAVALSGCGPQERIIPEIGVRLVENQGFVAPTDGWFLSDAELKDLFMKEYDGIVGGGEP